jgi:hypothetical protein
VLVARIIVVALEIDGLAVAVGKCQRIENDDCVSRSLYRPEIEESVVSDLRSVM